MPPIVVCVFLLLLSAITGMAVGFLRPARRGMRRLVMGFAFGVGGLYLANYSGVFLNLGPLHVLMLFTPFGMVGMFSLLWGAVAHFRETKDIRKTTKGTQSADPSANSPSSAQSLEQATRSEAVPSRFARLKQTEPFKTFLSHTIHRATTWIWLTISLLAGICFCVWFLEALTPPLKLDEMHTLSGTLERWNKPRKSIGYIVVRDFEGQSNRISKALFNTTRDILKKLRGKTVTVYYQNEITALLYFEKMAYEIEYNGKPMLGYDFEIRLHRSKATQRQTIYLALATLLPLLRIWWVNRKTQRLLIKIRKGEM